MEGRGVSDANYLGTDAEVSEKDYAAALGGLAGGKSKHFTKR
jgi:hypothetical protein